MQELIQVYCTMHNFVRHSSSLLHLWNFRAVFSSNIQQSYSGRRQQSFSGEKEIIREALKHFSKATTFFFSVHTFSSLQISAVSRMTIFSPRCSGSSIQQRRLNLTPLPEMCTAAYDLLSATKCAGGSTDELRLTHHTDSGLLSQGRTCKLVPALASLSYFFLNNV